jgi:hypothetical protein
MPKGIMVVQSSPCDPAREDEYNDWYSNTHLPEVCAVPGFVAGRRYKVHGGGAGQADPAVPSYVAIYEIDADDLTDPVKEVRARSATGQVHMSDVLQLDPPPVITVYELID